MREVLTAKKGKCLTPGIIPFRDDARNGWLHDRRIHSRASLSLIKVVEAFGILTLAVSSHSWWQVACSARYHLAPRCHNTFGLHRHLCRSGHYVILSSHNLHVLKVYTK